MASLSTHRKTIFLFLAVRSYISDLLHTPYLNYLRQKYNVVVFLRDSKNSGNPHDEYPQYDNVTYITFTEPKSRFWMLFDFYLRNEFIHIFDDNIAVQWRNKRAEDKNSKGRLRIRKIAKLFPKKLFTPSFFFILEQRLFPGYSIFKRYKDLYKPSAVLMATPGLNPFDTYALLCAKRASIPSVAINTSWDNLTSYPRHIKPVDYMIVWNNFMKQAAKNNI